GGSTSTGVSSIVDPGDGLGIQCSVAFTGVGTNDQMAIWPWSSSGVTLATLGVSNTDNAEYCIAAEISWSGATAGALQGVQLLVTSNGSGLYADADFGDLQYPETTGTFPDTMSARILRTGWFQASNTNFTAIVPQLIVAFNAATGNPFT